MTTRMLLLKLSATLAAMICGGCMPPISVSPQPQPAAKPLELKITIDGEGKINVGGDASITAKAEREPAPKTLCPCCGETGACRGLCGKAGCVCSRGQTSAASTVGTATDLPQFTTQIQRQLQCRNGVCGWYDVEVRGPVAAAGKRSVAPQTQRGNVRVLYEFDTDVIRQMKRDLKGVDFDHVRGEQIPAIGGYRWTPTAVKPDGSAWTPGAGGWHAQSAAQFEAWRAGQ